MSLLACRRVALRLAAIVALLSTALPAAAADDPASALIEGTAAKVIDLIKSKTGPEREAGIRQILEAAFDMAHMGRAALATHWDATSDPVRQRFLKAEISAEARAYSERFGQYAGQTLTLGRVTKKANGASAVDSRLNQSNGQPIKIEWEVRDSGQGWRITDVKIEGVSMVMTRRSEFNSYIQSHGGRVESLVEELEKRAGY